MLNRDLGVDSNYIFAFLLDHLLLEFNSYSSSFNSQKHWCVFWVDIISYVNSLSPSGLSIVLYQINHLNPTLERQENYRGSTVPSFGLPLNLNKHLSDPREGIPYFRFHIECLYTILSACHVFSDQLVGLVLSGFCYCCICMISGVCPGTGTQ